MLALQRVAWPAAIVVGIAFASACGDDTSGPGGIDQVVITAANGSSAPTLRRGQTLQLQARALNRGEEVSGVQFEWASESPGLATVDNSGRVSGLEFGTASITATPVGASNVVGRLNVPVVGPPVVTIFVESGAFVDIDDNVQLQAIAQDLAGASLTGVDFTWRSLSQTIAAVDATGRVTGHQPGQAVIEVEAWNGVKASVSVQVTPVRAIAPDTGRYGAVITIQGSGLPANPEVSFTGANPDSPVPAVVRGATANGIEVWVPVGAETGPIHVKSGNQTFQTSRSFTLAAKEDIFRWAAAGQPQDGLVTLPFPYYNPALLALADADRVHFFMFEVEEDSPFLMHLEDRGPRDGLSYLWARLFRVEPPNETGEIFLLNGLVWLETVDFFAGEIMDRAVFSQANLQAGHYLLIVNALAVEPTSRSYGLRLAAETDFAFAPDPYEPNDFPQIAPDVPLPFSGTDTRYENTFAFDHYVFELTEHSRVDVTLSDNGHYLTFLPENYDLMVAQHVSSPDADPEEERIPPTILGDRIAAVGGAGRYVLAVWDAAGRAREYTVQMTATPVPPEGEGEGDGEGEAGAVVSAFQLLSPEDAELDRGGRTAVPTYDWLAPVRARAATLRR